MRHSKTFTSIVLELVLLEVVSELLAASVMTPVVDWTAGGRTAASIPPLSVRMPRFGCNLTRNSSGKVANSVSLQYSILRSVRLGASRTSSRRCVHPVISRDVNAGQCKINVSSWRLLGITTVDRRGEETTIRNNSRQSSIVSDVMLGHAAVNAANASSVTEPWIVTVLKQHT